MTAAVVYAMGQAGQGQRQRCTSTYEAHEQAESAMAVERIQAANDMANSAMAAGRIEYGADLANRILQAQNPVYAMRGGVVNRAAFQSTDPTEGLGFRVGIEWGGGFDQYGHLDPDTVAVSRGAQIRAGQFIGEYGDPPTGDATGPHGHVETRVYSNPHIEVPPPDLLRSPLGPGGRVTSHFGAVRKINGQTNTHQGIDWAY